MDKKYELVKDDTITVDGHTLYRIRALRNVDVIETGMLGDYIQHEGNLSHGNECWIYDNTCVYNTALIADNAAIRNNAHVFDNACVCGNAQVHDNARIFNNAYVHNFVNIYSNAHIYDNANICGDTIISGNAHVHSDIIICGISTITGDADVTKDGDILVISGIGSDHRTTTAFKQKDGSVYIACGCYRGTLSAFEKRVTKVHGDTKHGKEYQLYIQLIKCHFNNEDKSTYSNYLLNYYS